jgi:hypothetical protein
MANSVSPVPLAFDQSMMDSAATSRAWILVRATVQKHAGDV